MKRYIHCASDMTPAMQKRCDEAKAFVMKCYNAATEDFYEEANGDTIYEEDIEDFGQTFHWAIDKSWVVYADSWDENDNRVKRGAKVPGSIHYEISLDYDTADETNFAFKTLEDAKKYMKILQEWEHERQVRLHSK